MVPEPSLEVEVTETADGSVTIYVEPHSGSQPVTNVNPGMVLFALEPSEVVRAKVGKTDQWLWVRTSAGDVGWVGSTHLRVSGSAAADESDLETVLFVAVDSPGQPTSALWAGMDFDEVTTVPAGR